VSGRATRRLLGGAAVLVATLVRAAGAQEGAGPPEPARCADRGHRIIMRSGAAAVFVGGNIALYEYFRRAWWSGERADKFRINWEQNEPFRQADKFGHALGGYHLTRAGAGVLKLACVSDRKAVTLGALYAVAFQLQIELWDATQAKYGFSPNDILANTAGTLYAVAQERYPTLRHVKPTFSFWPTDAYRNRHRFPAGAPGTELRPSLDYSGQTYWLSTDVDWLLPADLRRYWPNIVRLSLGHSITDYVDPHTGEFFKAKHRLLLSLDLDAERLPGDFPGWNFVKRQLSYIRFPAPALQITPTVRGIGWYR
jgi:hypothetical protein